MFLLADSGTRALLRNPSLLDAARAELHRLDGRSAWAKTCAVLLDAGVLPVVAVLTSTSEAARPLKADSPFAFVVELDPADRARLLEAAHAA